MHKSIRAIAAALVVAIVLPAAVVAHYPVANRYSYVTQRYWSGHKAYDLSSYKGTPVVPMTSGRVVTTGWRNDCGGYRVIVSHGNGLYTGYYHLSSISVYRGKYVYGSTTRLGRVGATGCTTGPHLHFEVWRGYPWSSGSYRIDPWRWINHGTYFPYRYR